MALRLINTNKPLHQETDTTSLNDFEIGDCVFKR